MKSELNNQTLNLGCIGVACLAFFVPLSTSLTSIMMLVLLGHWFFSKGLRERCLYVIQHPITPYLCVLVGLILLGTAHTTAGSDESWGSVRDAVRLLFIPMLMVYLSKDNQRFYVAAAFVAAMVITLILGFLKVYAGFDIGSKYTVGAVFKSHIKTSYFMAIAAFLLTIYGLSLQGKQKWLVFTIVFLMIYYLFFLSVGRVGHLTLFIWGLVLAWHRWHVKGIIIGLAGLIFAFVIAYQLSSVFSDRVNLLKQDWHYYQEGGRLIESSLGSRIQFAKSSVEIFKSHPIFGLGTGAYKSGYETFHKGEKILLTDNPHNEYFRLLVEGGLLGLFSLLALFIKQWQLTTQLPHTLRTIAQGGLASFYIGCFINSWLGDFTEAYFYCIFSAVLFSNLKRGAHPAVLDKLQVQE